MSPTIDLAAEELLAS